MLEIKKNANLRLKFSGLDSYEFCLDQKYFKDYKKNISYNYNSRGFRDLEWPNDLSDVVWCVGDSFTVGLGQPFEETWPFLLEKNIGKRCLNLGEDGCSNDTIALRTKEIINLYNPKILIVMWSYFSRRRVNNKDVWYFKKDFGAKKDFENFYKNFYSINTLKSNIIHLLVPNAFIDNTERSILLLDKKFKLLKGNQINKILQFNQLDYSRDYHHFDIKTSKYICDLIIKKIKDFTNN